MKILWAKSDFLHPTMRGGHIRTLEMLRRLHRHHEIHYIAYANPKHPEALDKAVEYSTAAYQIRHHIPSRRSVAFLKQAIGNLWDPLPLSIARYHSPPMTAGIADLLARHNFDVQVCDFLTMAPSFPDLSQCVLFQHNVESRIWERHANYASDPIRRAYMRLQYQRMLAYEEKACRAAAHIIAVSEVDRETMKDRFGVSSISVVPTGVDVDYFAPKPVDPVADLVFVGAMDWMPNIDGILYFTSHILPLIRRHRPDCSLVIAGRAPGPDIKSLERSNAGIRVTGTVPDIRPYVWGSKVSIVPLRIGGGTRLKIYEAMAAGKPVVSTSVGAEGLEIEDGRDIFLADDPESFASRCVELLENLDLYTRMSIAARQRAATASWDSLADRFEAVLRGAVV